MAWFSVLGLIDSCCFSPAMLIPPNAAAYGFIGIGIGQGPALPGPPLNLDV